MRDEAAVGPSAVLHVDVADDLVDPVAVVHGPLQDLGDLARVRRAANSFLRRAEHASRIRTSRMSPGSSGMR